MTQIEIHIALGTNLGDRRANLLRAIELLRTRMQITRLSSLYETEAAYVTDQPEFLNMALGAQIDDQAMPPRDLLRFVNEIERRMGRERLVRYGPRVIDVDILSYGDRLVMEEDLIIPHPRIVERDFVLAPLQEIAPDLVLPGQTKSVSELARALPGIGKVMRVERLDIG